MPYPMSHLTFVPVGREGQIAQMLLLQDKLNTRTLGPDWIQQASAVDRKVFYDLAYAEELFELANTVHYKWWTASKHSPEYVAYNTKIELVDALHFLLSMYLIKSKQALCTTTDFSDYPYLEGAAELIEKFEVGSNASGTEWKLQLRKCLSSTFERQLQLYAGHVNDYVEESSQAYADFSQLCACFGLDIEKLYTLYVAKNILNEFRQDHGYSEGTYQKVWLNGKEDSFYLFTALEEEGLSLTEVATFLEDRYVGVLAELGALN